MRALVIGTGAVGSFLGAALEERGFLPAFIGRHGPRAHTARVTFPGNQERLVCCRPTEPEQWRSAAIAFVATKAFDLEQALVWAETLTPGTSVISVANGAVEGLVLAAAARAPHLNWRLGFSTIGVSALEAPQSYAVRTKTGEIAFGPLPGAGATEPTAAERLLLEKPGTFAWHGDIPRLSRRKWLFNVVMNTLCAARGIARNGDLLGDIPTLSAVFHEAWALGEERYGAWSVGACETYKAMEALITATADNENSMARDKRLGRRTETAFLAGLATDKQRYPLLTSLAALAV